MRSSWPKRITIPVVMAVCVFACVQLVAAAPQDQKCELPADLQHQLLRLYPNARLATLSDLDADDRSFFQKDHGDACPSLVRADFYGDGKPTLALVLIEKSGARGESKLVLAHRVEGHWVATLLDTGGAGASVPVVWSQPPGRYRDVYGEREIRATRPVIVFTGYESWSILYAWTGTRVTKIWLMD